MRCLRRFQHDMLVHILLSRLVQSHALYRHSSCSQYHVVQRDSSCIPSQPVQMQCSWPRHLLLEKSPHCSLSSASTNILTHPQRKGNRLPRRPVFVNLRWRIRGTCVYVDSLSIFDSFFPPKNHSTGLRSRVIGHPIAHVSFIVSLRIFDFQRGIGYGALWYRPIAIHIVTLSGNISTIKMLCHNRLNGSTSSIVV